MTNHTLSHKKASPAGSFFLPLFTLMRQNLRGKKRQSESDYQQWKQALDEAVVEKRFAKEWRTCMKWSYNYTDFEMTEEKFHGVSMYIPQDPNTEYGKYYAQNNEDIKQLKWYQSVW